MMKIECRSYFQVQILWRRPRYCSSRRGILNHLVELERRASFKNLEWTLEGQARIWNNQILEYHYGLCTSLSSADATKILLVPWSNSDLCHLYPIVHVPESSGLISWMSFLQWNSPKYESPDKNLLILPFQYGWFFFCGPFHTDNLGVGKAIGMINQLERRVGLVCC